MQGEDYVAIGRGDRLVGIGEHVVSSDVRRSVNLMDVVVPFVSGVVYYLLEAVDGHDGGLAPVDADLGDDGHKDFTEFGEPQTV